MNGQITYAHDGAQAFTKPCLVMSPRGRESPQVSGGEAHRNRSIEALFALHQGIFVVCHRKMHDWSFRLP